MAVVVRVGHAAAAAGADDAALRSVEAAARAALRDRDIDSADLSITLMEDEAMAAMNREWKGRDGPTDVLAFSLGGAEGAEEPVLGDIYIDVEQVERQAREYGEPTARELARVAVHATLHVLGWDHPEEEREESEMWRHQERILEGLESA